MVYNNNCQKLIFFLSSTPLHYYPLGGLTLTRVLLSILARYIHRFIADDVVVVVLVVVLHSRLHDVYASSVARLS